MTRAIVEKQNLPRKGGGIGDVVDEGPLQEAVSVFLPRGTNHRGADKRRSNRRAEKKESRGPGQQKA